jgi:hypothetical protein
VVCSGCKLRLSSNLEHWWIVSPVVVYEELKEAATVSLGKVELRQHQLNQEHHDDHREDHYGTCRTR